MVAKENPQAPPFSAEKPLTERQRRLRDFWAKSDAAIAAGMPVLSLEQIRAEVSELRGNARGEL